MRARWLLPVCFLAACEQDPARLAEEARERGDYAVAADLFGQSAARVPCPEQGSRLLAKAEMLELDGRQGVAMETIDAAIAACPGHADAIWARAQRAAESGDTARAIEDSALIRDERPEAAALHDKLTAEIAQADAVRSRSRTLADALMRALVAEAPDTKLDRTDPAALAREVPIPVSLRYAVTQSVTGSSRFELAWEEAVSYRGDPAEPTYVLVRTLDMPPLDRELPVTVRLLMANQRLPMRFLVEHRGRVVDAAWLSRGPDRGMRPEMLRPEIEGMLRRRRVYDPGESGQRAVGESWSGEDVRIVDGQPVSLTFQSRLVGWATVQGVETVEIRSELKSSAYSGTETAWVHAASAVPIRIAREVRYSVRDERGAEAWSDRSRYVLIKVSGGE